MIVRVIDPYRVIAEPCNVTLVTTIEENRSTFGPVRSVDEVSLSKCPGVSKVEVVQLMETQRVAVVYG